MSDLKIARGFGLPLDLVTEATAIVATRGAGKSSASAVIVEEAFGLDVQAVVFDRTGVYWGLRSNAKGDGPGLSIYVLGGPHGDAPLEPHAGSMIADLVVDSGHSFVLDLSDFSKSAAVRFAADFLERLYDRKARSRSTTLLVMDEAHFYAPQTPRGGFKGDSARLMGAMEDVVGLGRSRGLGVVLTTQRTQALNKAILDLIETLLVMRMLSPRARDAVQDWIREKQEDDREGVIASLDALPTGTAWVWSPLRGILQKVAIRRIKTFDSYATPKPGQTRVEPTARKELDLDALGAEMRATAERARENDPAELRKRLRAAEQLATGVREIEATLDAARDALNSHGENAAEWLANLYIGVADALDVPWSADVVDEVRALATDRPSLIDEEKLKELRDLIFNVKQCQKEIEAEYGSLREVLEPLAANVLDALQREQRTVPDRKVADQVRQPGRPLSPGFRQKPLVLPETRVELPEETRLNGSLPQPQQRILDAISWYEALGVRQPSRTQVAVIAGYSAKSGGFANLLGKLSTSEHITYPSAGLVTLTDSGRALAAHHALPSSNEGVQAEVMSRLSAPEAKLLKLLIDAYPSAVTRTALAERADYSPTSGGFANLLGKLRTKALIDYPDKGHVVALDVLFPLG